MCKIKQVEDVDRGASDSGSSTRRLTLSVLTVARTAPELMPAFLWLLATSHRLKSVRAIQQSPPPAAELAALASCGGEAVVDLLWQRRSLRKEVQRVDFAQRGLLDTRLKALRRLGLGVESLVSLEERDIK